MLQIISPQGEKKLFENYHEACNHFNNIERPKRLETGKIDWAFMRRRYETLSSLYYRTPSLRDFLTPKEKEAVEKELGLVEMIKGNHVIQLLFTSNLDMEPLKRDWCQEYCKEHGFEIIRYIAEQ